MQTVRDFVSRLWYTENMMIIPYKHEPITYPTLDNFRQISIYEGINHTLKDNEILNKWVKSYGVIDSVLIIEVEG